MAEPTFSQWLDTFIQEKGIDTEEMFEVEGPGWGTNFIPLGSVVEAMKSATAQEQADIKTVIVKIDFKNGNVVDYFRHLAKAIAL